MNTTIQTAKLVIQSSPSHDQFVVGVNSRPIHKSLVKKLVHSMQENGWVASYPALVKRLKKGGKQQILDGQHRYLAARELGIPVVFVETEADVTATDMASLPYLAQAI